MRKSQVVNFARAINPEENLLRQVLCRRRVLNHSTEELTSGVRYFCNKRSKDAVSTAFTSSMSWTSVLAIASTVYLTRTAP